MGAQRYRLINGEKIPLVKKKNTDGSKGFKFVPDKRYLPPSQR